MKWGVRKKRPMVFERDGSKNTVNKLNKFIDANEKYGSDSSRRQNRHINKLYKQYDKSAKKDVKEALKRGDTKVAKSIAAGRTYFGMLMDSNNLEIAVGTTAQKANVGVGKDFVYDLLRDDTFGGVKITVNGVSDYYTYHPETHY